MRKYFLHLGAFVCLGVFFSYLQASAEPGAKDKDLFSEADSLIGACLRYIELKDFRRAGEALGLAYESAELIKEPNSREIILYELSDKYLLLDRIEDAYRIAKAIEFEDSQSEAFVKIAFKCVERKEFPLMLRIIREIKDPLSQAKAFYRITNKLTDLGLYDETIKLAKEAEESKLLVEEFISVHYLARKLLKENDTPDNYSVNLSEPDEPYLKSKELTAIAGRYFDYYLFDQARKILARSKMVAEKINLAPLRQDALFKIELVRNKIIKSEKSLRIPENKNNEEN